MSARTPVALIYLPNQPYLIGTFDTSAFKNWWRSNPFPDAIEFIKKGMHVYGRKQLVIAKRTDGRWAVYLSKNYGIDWERVFLAEVGEIIYDIILIKFGWVILNTSTGFYESVKAGSDGSWNLISSLPGASAVPAFCNIGEGDIILCTDGRYIWRSTDKAHTWTLKCDQASLTYRRALWSRSGQVLNDWFAWSGTPKCAAIAGANGEVLCAYGPFMSWSHDGGLTWATHEFWDVYVNYPGFEDETGGIVFPPKNIVWNRFPENSTANAQFVIKQILVSEVNGPLQTDVRYVVRTDDLIPVPGETKPLSRVFFGKHGWYKHNIIGEESIDPWPKMRYKFQQSISPDENLNQLSCFETAIMGSTGIDKVVVSAQTTVDSEGNPIPSFKYSIDGGDTWNTLDVGTLRVADSEGLPVSGGSFLDDSYAKVVWIWGSCDNVGYWRTIADDTRTQCQSYEMDLALESAERDVEKPQPVDAIVEKDGEEPESVDAILEKSQAEPYPVDGLFDGVATKTYRVDRTLEGVPEKEVSVDSIVSMDKSEDESVDAILEKNIRLIYKVDMGLHDKNSRSYLVDTKLVKDDLNKRLARVRRTFPQVFDLWLPEIPQGVYNSAWEFIE